MQNGQVVRTVNSKAKAGHFTAQIELQLTIDKPCWLALRTPPPTADRVPEFKTPTPSNEYGRELFSHTSAVFVDVAGQHVFQVAAVESLLEEARRSRELIAGRGLFANDAERQRLEAILHPRIRGRALEISTTLGGPYQIMVVPLLIETDFQQLVDRILVVDCPESMQRERLTKRDDEDPDQADRIMSAQLSRKERLRSADDVIDNAGTREQTRQQVDALHRVYLGLAGSE